MLGRKNKTRSQAFSFSQRDDDSNADFWSHTGRTKKPGNKARRDRERTMKHAEESAGGDKSDREGNESSTRKMDATGNRTNVRERNFRSSRPDSRSFDKATPQDNKAANKTNNKKGNKMDTWTDITASLTRRSGRNI